MLDVTPDEAWFTRSALFWDTPVVHWVAAFPRLVNVEDQVSCNFVLGMGGADWAAVTSVESFWHAPLTEDRFLELDASGNDFANETTSDVSAVTTEPLLATHFAVPTAAAPAPVVGVLDALVVVVEPAEELPAEQPATVPAANSSVATLIIRRILNPSFLFELRHLIERPPRLTDPSVIVRSTLVTACHPGWGDRPLLPSGGPLRFVPGHGHAAGLACSGSGGDCRDATAACTLSKT